MARVAFEVSDALNVVERKPPTSKGKRARARRGPPSDDGFPQDFLAPGVSVDKDYDVTGAGARRSAGPPLLQFKVTGGPNESFVAVVRHASGALTFHAADETVIERAPKGARGRRRAAKRPWSARATSEHSFRILLPSDARGARRGGLADLGAGARLFILKVVDVIVSPIIRTLVSAWEKKNFAKKGIAEGFVKVTAAGLAAGRLTAAPPVKTATPSGRALLLIHGTFSNTANSFQHLAQTNFFAEAAKRYGDQIYGFEHYSLSKTPEENARDLLQGLLGADIEFDVVTYSRGGLVLRNILERPEAFDGLASRFRLGEAVLVASPNQGTALATPKRWHDTIGWLATIIGHFPDNPFTLAASFIAEAIVWIARHAGGDIPGLASMDANGAQIGALQNTQGGDINYSALVANHIPEPGLWAKLADVGIDAFFGQANDLVVPTEGGWGVDVAEGEGVIPSERVACYGQGGNVASVTNGANHLNFFGRPETVDFLFTAFAGRPHPYPKLDLNRVLPNGLRRGARAQLSSARAAASRPAPARSDASALPGSESIGSVGQVSGQTPSVFSEAFHITIVPPPEGVREIDAEAADNKPRRKVDTALIVASYAGGRVISPLGLAGGAAGKRWQRLIEREREIKAFIDGVHGAGIPSNEDMLEYGRLLFETLFPKNVRRLYDTARARLPNGRLSLIFTSAIPWVAETPWEFSWDPAMEAFLVTEELEFIRNPLTAEPAEIIKPNADKLRVLVVVAQPLDQNPLSVDEEAERIRASFEELTGAGVLELEILHQATPERLHQYVRQRTFDIVHFIGHGEYDDGADTGYLIFENQAGMTQKVSARSMKEILGGRNIRLVFLNACETGRNRGGARTDFNRGVAQALVASGIHSVVANQYLVLDVAAVGFAQHFYWGLARGETIGSAAREARIAVNYSIAGENIDWAVPVVYARDPGARLSLQRERPLVLNAAAKAAATARAQRSARAARGASAPEPTYSVAVWDMDNSFPGSKAAIERLNSAQDTYDIASVDLGAPLGSLQRDEDGDMEMFANAAEPRIKRAQQEAGADYLIAITRRRITYEEGEYRYWGYYLWWPDEGGGKYAIVSSDVEGMARTGEKSERAFGNLLALALIGAGSKLGTHMAGNKTCPLYFNSDVDAELIGGAQHLEPSCRARIKAKMPHEIAAIEAILRAFDSEKK